MRIGQEPTFHHRERNSKKFVVAHGIAKRLPFQTLIEEAEKCDVVCLNCQSIRLNPIAA